jgi:hypothetical protein
MHIMGIEVNVFIFPYNSLMSYSASLPAGQTSLPTGCRVRRSSRTHNSYSHVKFNEVLKLINCCEVIAPSAGLEILSLLWKSKVHYSVAIARHQNTLDESHSHTLSLHYVSILFSRLHIGLPVTLCYSFFQSKLTHASLPQGGHAVSQLRHYATNRKVADSIPDEVILGHAVA